VNRYAPRLIHMQNLLLRLSGTTRWFGRRHGQDTVLGEPSLSPQQIDALRAEGAT
jgi:hypothetical protein